MAEEDFVVETYVDLIRKAHEEIHTVYVRESRKLAENLRNFIKNLIISQGFPGHGTNKNTKYQKWKDKHGNGLNIELVLTGQLLYDSIIIKQIDYNENQDYYCNNCHYFYVKHIRYGAKDNSQGYQRQIPFWSSC